MSNETSRREVHTPEAIMPAVGWSAVFLYPRNEEGPQYDLVPLAAFALCRIHYERYERSTGRTTQWAGPVNDDLLVHGYAPSSDVGIACAEDAILSGAANYKFWYYKAPGEPAPNDARVAEEQALRFADCRPPSTQEV